MDRPRYVISPVSDGFSVTHYPIGSDQPTPTADQLPNAQQALSNALGRAAKMSLMLADKTEAVDVQMPDGAHLRGHLQTEECAMIIKTIHLTVKTTIEGDDDRQWWERLKAIKECINGSADALSFTRDTTVSTDAILKEVNIPRKS